MPTLLAEEKMNFSLDWNRDFVYFHRVQFRLKSQRFRWRTKKHLNREYYFEILPILICSMEFYILRYFFILFSAVSLTACVSVNLADSNESQKSKMVEFKAPAKPFADFKTDFVDQAWKNSKNGNSISFLSECNSAADPSLDTIHRGLISSIDKAESVDKKNFNHVLFSPNLCFLHNVGWQTWLRF